MLKVVLTVVLAVMTIAPSSAWSLEKNHSSSSKDEVITPREVYMVYQGLSADQKNKFLKLLLQDLKTTKRDPIAPTAIKGAISNGSAPMAAAVMMEPAMATTVAGTTARPTTTRSRTNTDAKDVELTTGW